MKNGAKGKGAVLYNPYLWGVFRVIAAPYQITPLD